MTRQDSAIKLINDNCVAQVFEDHFQVLSKRTGNGYNITIENGTFDCECMDFRFRHLDCKHILAVKIFSGKLEIPA